MDNTLPISPLPVRVAREALVRSLPTLAHAVDLYAAVSEALGDQAYHDPDGGEVCHQLYRRDAQGWLVPRCVVEQSFAGRVIRPIEVRGGGELLPPPAPQVPRIMPKRFVRPGHIRLDDGEGSFEIAYNAHGVMFETSSSGGGLMDRRDWEDLPYRIDPQARPPTRRPLALLCSPDLVPEGVDLATLCGWVAAIDPGARVPARVWLPVPRPGGVAGVLRVGVAGLRQALFAEPPPPEARFVVVDGVAGTAIGYGASEDEAFAAWQRAVWRVKPWVPRPAAPEGGSAVGDPGEGGPGAEGSDAPGDSAVGDPGEGGRSAGGSDAPGDAAVADPGEGRRSAGGSVERLPTIGPRRTDRATSGDRERPPSVQELPDGSTRYDLGTFVLTGAGSAVAPPVDTPETLPAVRIPLTALDLSVPPAWSAQGFTRRVVLVGARGHLSTALLRPEASQPATSFVLVGEGLLDRLDPTTLLADLARAEAKRPSVDPFAEGHGPRWARLTFVLDHRGELALVSSGHGPGFSFGMVEGDAQPWQVLRVRGPG